MSNKLILTVVLLCVPAIARPAMVTFSEGVLVPNMTGVNHSAGPNFNNFAALDGSGEKYATVFKAPKTGNIVGMCLKLGSITTGASPDVRLETIDTSGNPSGTSYCGSSISTMSFSGTDDNKMICSGDFSGCAVVKGSTMSFVVINGTGNFQVNGVQDLAPSDFSHSSSSTSASGWVKNTTNLASFAIKYDDGSYPVMQNIIPMTTITNVSLTATSDPNVAGNKFRFPIDVQVSAVWTWADLDSSDGDVVIYDTDGATVISTSTVVGAARATANGGMQYWPMVPAVTLSANQDYRVCVRSWTATGNSIYKYGYETTPDLYQAVPYNEYMTYTSAQNPTGTGSWTDDASYNAVLGVVISGFGTGGAGGTAGIPYLE